jgi:hypothetical protein
MGAGSEKILLSAADESESKEIDRKKLQNKGQYIGSSLL